MPTLASPLRAGVASRSPWPTAPRSASSIWTTTPWVRLKEGPCESHHPTPIQELGTIACHGNPTPTGGWREEGEVGGSREATCVEDQMSTRYLKVSITTRGPGLLHLFTPQSRCHPAPPKCHC